MNHFTLELSDDFAQALRDRAREEERTVEELLQSHVEEWLASQVEFADAANRVLRKNQELYRRLA